MGAGQAVQIGLANVDKFSAIGSFSGGGVRNIEENAANLKKIAVLWFGAGTAEAGRVSSGKAQVEAMKNAGIPATWFESPGTAHEWQTWRRSLWDFAPRLFRNGKR
jgi:enterochelin esterase family protein